jgi:hypothetical protein
MTHADYKYSITIKSDDLAVINCLRSLSQYSQQSGNVRIPWGGTKKRDWERDGHTVTFRFTAPRVQSRAGERGQEASSRRAVGGRPRERR